MKHLIVDAVDAERDGAAVSGRLERHIDGVGQSGTLRIGTSVPKHSRIAETNETFNYLSRGANHKHA